MATQSQQTWAVRELQRRKMEATTPKEKIALQRDILRAQRDPAYLEELARIGEKGKWQSGLPFKAKLGLAGLALSTPILGAPAAAAGLGTLGLAAMGIPTGLEALSRRRAGMPWGWQALESGLDVAAPGIAKAVGAVRAAGGARRAAAEAAKAAKAAAKEATSTRVFGPDDVLPGVRRRPIKRTAQEEDAWKSGQEQAKDKEIIERLEADTTEQVGGVLSNILRGRTARLPSPPKLPLMHEKLLGKLDREFPKINPLHPPHISSQLVDPRQGGRVVQTSSRLTGDELQRGVVRPGSGLKIDVSEAEKAKLLKRSPPSRGPDVSDKGAVLNQWFHRPGVGWTRRGLGDDISRAPGSPLSRGEQASEFISQDAYDDMFRSLTNKGLSPEEARSYILRPLEKLGSFKGSRNLYPQTPLSKADAEGVMASRMPTATPTPPTTQTVTPQTPTGTPGTPVPQGGVGSVISGTQEQVQAANKIAEDAAAALTKGVGSRVTPPTPQTVTPPTVKTPTVDTLKTPTVDTPTVFEIEGPIAKTTVGKAFDDVINTEKWKDLIREQKDIPKGKRPAVSRHMQQAAAKAILKEMNQYVDDYAKVSPGPEGQKEFIKLIAGGPPGFKIKPGTKQKIPSLAGSVIGSTKGTGGLRAGGAGTKRMEATRTRFSPDEKTAVNNRLSEMFTEILNDDNAPEAVKKKVLAMVKPPTTVNGVKEYEILTGKARDLTKTYAKRDLGGGPNSDILRLQALLGVSERSKVYGKILTQLVTKTGDRTMEKALSNMKGSFTQAFNNIIHGKAYDQKKTDAIIKAITDANIELSALIAMIGGSQVMTQGTPPDATNR
jgi:hypothetical protein